MNDTLLQAVIALSALLLAAAALAAGVRIVRGPAAADRVIALDMLGLLGVAAAGLAALVSDAPAFVDVALGVALVGFLATVAFAGFIARGRLADGPQQAPGDMP
ncbi:MAG: cation:proton antiporter [Hydrogenophaga sp.]|uniref:monovalent cation/H+ antiporter complex subunit F n=1 Tax=Hydrogenophaga sp. TaxID=1904254 RepID=UPI00257A77F7|nr:monovalent cation/H+ antiporter complex subunit F [Hydrogenophaga sp.]MBL0943382.1 cation:proton antiporter [Hydrogenophaga sp.]